jgi:N6-adenosine-specific RNA methylase IME4
MRTRKTLTVIKPDKDAAAIGELYRKARLSLIESVRYAHTCGERLIAKKATLTHGQWLPWLAANADVLGFETRRTAARLMSLAANGTLTSHFDEARAVTYSRQLWGNADDPDSGDHDPDEIDLDSLLRDEHGELTPKARSFIREVRAEKVAKMRAVRDAREAALAGKLRALPDKWYGVIYADPPWRFETWGDAGKATTSADNHYPCMSLAEIMALDVASIAAPDCALFIWVTVPMDPRVYKVAEEWGFDPEPIEGYKTEWVWVKDQTGTGYWNWNQHETIRLFTRGKIPAPAPGKQWSSVIEAPRGKHSEKPKIFYELIESYFPNLPKIELFARKRREGWDAWGNEVPEI